MAYTLPEIYYQDPHLSTTAIESATPGEQRLWQRVLHQLIIDAQGKAAGIGQVERQRVQQAAIRWFSEGGRDFQEVCGMAGYQPEWVREKVMEMLKKVELRE